MYSDHLAFAARNPKEVVSMENMGAILEEKKFQVITLHYLNIYFFPY